MTDWQHPTGKVPKSVLVIALGPTKQGLLELTTKHEPPPEVMDVDELWGMNGGVNHLAGRVAYDVLWIMDHLDGEAHRLPRYAELIRRWQTRFGSPIITSQAGAWAGSPGVHEYPLAQVLQRFGNDHAYFHNSVPYILAYALMIGVERLVLWGADYSHEAIKRREDDRANAEYWVGYCRAKGMKVQVPQDTTLLNTDRQPWFYGYREQPLHVLS